ncbi:HEPN domain-containing protein [Paeniroseomonas aquatica]|uniref:HEPN domain-containing protein n=1 Tax=Paeniroseomonas aquatica TaxID=373043 RepID=A0ABT8AH68_9PROT|nr:HEPN domain-containing protein [Paeniroseomonas aquatica]MDN3568709.1 HEPN domain-containing protein [Paeniroseomonas aquatica]
MSLKPDPRIQKAVISTTSRLVGEFENAGILITHAFPGIGSRDGWIRMEEGPNARNAYIVSFVTETPTVAAGWLVPDYTGTVERFCQYLSLLYGKRFDNHGLIETSGLYNIPDLSHFNSICNHTLPQNSYAPRADYSIPMHLAEISRLEPLFHGVASEKDSITKFNAACKFYHRALQAVERDPEVAYLHLISSGEILSQAVDVDKESLLSVEFKNILTRIEDDLEDGKRIGKILRHELRGLKSRFIGALEKLTSDDFFDKSESKEIYFGLKKERFKVALGAAYDLRSRYVHSGVGFGSWVAPRGSNEEIQAGEPVLDSKKLAKILFEAPTYIGLERIVRQSLLSFAGQKYGLDLLVKQDITPPTC